MSGRESYKQWGHFMSKSKGEAISVTEGKESPVSERNFCRTGTEAPGAVGVSLCAASAPSSPH